MEFQYLSGLYMVFGNMPDSFEKANERDSAELKQDKPAIAWTGQR